MQPQNVGTWGAIQGLDSFTFLLFHIPFWIEIGTAHYPRNVVYSQIGSGLYGLFRTYGSLRIGGCPRSEGLVKSESNSTSA